MAKIMRGVLSLIILDLQMSVISNNPTQTASYTDRFSLGLFVMLDFSRSFIRNNEYFFKK